MAVTYFFGYKLYDDFRRKNDLYKVNVRELMDLIVANALRFADKNNEYLKANSSKF